MISLNLKKILLLNQIFIFIFFIHPFFLVFEKPIIILCFLFSISVIFFWKKSSSLIHAIVFICFLLINYLLGTEQFDIYFKDNIDEYLKIYDYYTINGIIAILYYFNQYLFFYPLLSIILLYMEKNIFNSKKNNKFTFLICYLSLIFLISLQLFYTKSLSKNEIGIYIIYTLQLLYILLIFLFFLHTPKERKNGGANK